MIFVTKKGVAKTAVDRVWWRLERQFFILLMRQDIPTHFWITHEKRQLSCSCEKLNCNFLPMIFHGDTFLLEIYDQEFPNRFAVQSICEAIPILTKFVVRRYDSFWYAIFHDFWRKNLHRSRLCQGLPTKNFGITFLLFVLSVHACFIQPTMKKKSW